MKKGYNPLMFRALEFFINNPYEEIHLRGFSRRVKISLNSSQRALKLFLNEELIKEERKANLRYFKANLDSLVFKYIKKTYSIKKIINLGLIESLKNEVSHLVLFGSIAKGEDDKNSDIDLLGISANKNKVKKIIFNYYKKVDREINFHVFSWAEWKKQKEQNKAFYQEIISTGINLIGGVPIVD